MIIKFITPLSRFPLSSSFSPSYVRATYFMCSYILGEHVVVGLESAGWHTFLCVYKFHTNNLLYFRREQSRCRAAKTRIQRHDEMTSTTKPSSYVFTTYNDCIMCSSSSTTLSSSRDDGAQFLHISSNTYFKNRNETCLEDYWSGDEYYHHKTSCSSNNITGPL